MVIINNFDEYKAFEGKEIGVSDWHTITQEQINRFADATIDHQWIHTDPEKAKKEGPFKNCAWIFNTFYDSSFMGSNCRGSKYQNVNQLRYRKFKIWTTCFG